MLFNSVCVLYRLTSFYTSIYSLDSVVMHVRYRSIYMYFYFFSFCASPFSYIVALLCCLWSSLRSLPVRIETVLLYIPHPTSCTLILRRRLLLSMDNIDLAWWIPFQSLYSVQLAASHGSPMDERQTAEKKNQETVGWCTIFFFFFLLFVLFCFIYDPFRLMSVTYPILFIVYTHWLTRMHNAETSQLYKGEVTLA